MVAPTGDFSDGAARIPQRFIPQYLSVRIKDSGTTLAQGHGMTHEQQRQQLRENKQQLTQAGYIHTMSVMDDCGTGGIYYAHPDGRTAVIRRGRIEYSPADVLPLTR